MTNEDAIRVLIRMRQSQFYGSDVHEAIGVAIDAISVYAQPPEEYTGKYDEAYLNEKIKKATKSWDGVCVDKFMEEVRGLDSTVDDEANEYASHIKITSTERIRGVHERLYVFKDLVDAFVAGSIYQANQDGRDIVFWRGMQYALKRLKEEGVERIVKVDAGGYPYIDATELYDYTEDRPLAKRGDKVFVVIL